MKPRLRLTRPMSLRRHSRRFALSLLIAGVIAVLVTGLFTRGQLDLIQLQFGDTFFRTKPVEKARASVIIGVDEKSLAALKDDGRFFNWPRRLHARVIENLYNAGARVIVFDMLFDARSEDDDELARAMKMVNADPRRAIVQPVAGDESGIQSNVYGEPIAYSDLLQPLPKLLEAAPIVGHTNQFPDPDGSIRRVPLVIRVGDQRIPALPLVAVAKWLRRPQVLEGPAENGYLPFPGRQLPIDGFYRMFVNWLGPPSVVGDANSSVPQISYVDVLNNNFDPALVKDKMAFLGVTAGYFADDYWVPTARVVKMDGVEIHAQTAETIAGKQGGGISAGLFAPPPDWVTILLIFSAAILMALAVYALSPLAAVGIGLAAIFLYMVAAQYFFIQGALLNLFAPPLSLVLAFAALMVNRIALEQREQRVLKSLFASYVPADVVQELANDPDQMRRLGGERREITVLFCDLKGFTSFSETVEPEVLAEVINRYLTAMTRVIFEYRGTVDKYIGDAVMAFWNAPQPIAQHAANACSAALKMQAELRVLSAEQEALGMPPLRQRVGINTGIAAVGNMGSDLRIAYTALGDTVNLGARLEPLNNEYSTGIIISEFTLRSAGEDRFLTRFLDMVAVKGRTEPVAVYELIAERPLNGFPDEATVQMLEHFDQGMQFYRERDFVAAEVAFSAAAELKPDDGPTTLFLERSRQLVVEPPSSDWDGVFVMTRK